MSYTSVMPKQFSIVGLGEALWDVFEDESRFGGAPANFACHAASLGNRAAMLTAVGRDQRGDLAIDFLESRNVDTACVSRSEMPTGTVNVTVCDGSPSYQIREDAAWDQLEWSSCCQELAASCDAVCFGTLGQRSKKSRATIARFLKECGEDCLRVLDVNLRQAWFDDAVLRDSLALANVAKLNDEELPVVCRSASIAETGVEALQALLVRFELQAIALTRGSQGSTLVTAAEVSAIPAQATTVADTVGAGDAFTAALVTGMLHGLELDTINKISARVAAYVCGCHGATPALPHEITELFNASNDKVSNPEDVRLSVPHLDR